MFTKPLFHMAPNAQMMSGLLMVVISGLWPFLMGLHAYQPVVYLGMPPSYMPGAWLAWPAMMLSTIIALMGLIRTDSLPSWHWSPIFKRNLNAN